ncbi:MAG: DNA-3-methyladenine glycosylase I [Candidatus Kurthia intestinigallinarum]
MEKFRCRWCEHDADLIHYHDKIWGTKRETDDELFEALTFEIFQAGLKWATVYRKRDGFKRAFANFTIQRVAQFDDAKKKKLKEDATIIRHTAKIAATVYNAQQLLTIQKQYGSFKNFLDVVPPENRIEQLCAYFKQVGKTTAESFLIACGYLPTQHEKRCYLYTKSEEEKI